jgi:hypothetical protein
MGGLPWEIGGLPQLILYKNISQESLSPKNFEIKVKSLFSGLSSL